MNRDRPTVEEALAKRPRVICHGRNGIPCGAPMWWCRTTNGRPIPLDFEPTSAGNLVVVAVGPDPNRMGDELAFWVATYAPLEDPEGTETRFISHFATCSAASEFRKAKHGGGKKGRR